MARDTRILVLVSKGEAQLIQFIDIATARVLNPIAILQSLSDGNLRLDKMTEGANSPLATMAKRERSERIPGLVADIDIVTFYLWPVVIKV